MTSQILSNNKTYQSIVMNSKFRRTSTYFRRNTIKPDLSKAKVCFAENLETVHEVPYNNDISKKANFRQKITEIKAHRYTPLLFRDPYAKPSKRKKAVTFANMFATDAVKLPLLKEKTTDRNAKNGASSTIKEATESLSDPQLPKARARNTNKFQVGNTLHFKYSDFILSKMDRSATSKTKMFIVM